MKAHLIFIAFVFCAFSFGCKKDSSTISDGINFKTFNFQADYALTTYDKCFLVVNNIAGSIAKIDANGNFLWEKRGLFKSYDALNTTNTFIPIKITTSSQFITTAEVVSDSIVNAINYRHLALNKIDLNGNSVLKKKFPFPEFINKSTFLNFNLILLEQGDIVFELDYRVVGTFYFTQRISAAGNIIWGSVNSNASLEPTNLVSFEDLSFYILKKGVNSLSFVKYNSLNGTPIGITNISSLIPNGNEIKVSINPQDIVNFHKLSNSDIVFSGLTQRNSNTEKVYDWFAYRISANIDSIAAGYFLGAKKYGGYSCLDNNGNLITTGSGSENISSTRFMTQALNISTFQISWKPSYEGLSDYNGLACIANLDGTISVIGNIGKIIKIGATNTTIYNPTHTFHLRLNSEDGNFAN